MVHEDHSPGGGQSQVNMRTKCFSQDASSVNSHTNLQSGHLKCNVLYSLPSIFTLFTDPGCTAEASFPVRLATVLGEALFVDES